MMPAGSAALALLCPRVCAFPSSVGRNLFSLFDSPVSRPLRRLCFSSSPSANSRQRAIRNFSSYSDGGAAVMDMENNGLENMAIDVNPPKGTRDFPPEEMRIRSWLFQNFREVSRLFAFEEVDFPVLESEALFIRKAGEEITEQLYSFEDKGGRRVALRPELTPSLARLIIQKGKSVSLPIKWFTIGQCWRYERMTRGRRREHYQWNMDIIGITEVTAEAELIFAIVTLFKQLGITSSDVGFKVSSRKVLQAAMQQCSISEHLFTKVCITIDKIGKMEMDEIEKDLASSGIPMESVKTLLHIVSLKTIPELEEALSDQSAIAELRQLFSLAEHYGYLQWIEFDASVVRGLAYYTGIVFELLKEKGLLPALSLVVDDIVFAIDGALQGTAVMVTSTLRQKGRKVDIVLERKKLKWVFKHAERINASRLILIGESEWQQGMVRVKNLSTREESNVKIDDL